VAKSSKHTNLQHPAINKYCKRFIYNRSKDDCYVKMKLLDHSGNLTFVNLFEMGASLQEPYSQHFIFGNLRIGPKR